MGAHRIALLLEALENGQETLARRNSGCESREQSAEPSLPGIPFVCLSENRRPDRVEVGRHQIGELRTKVAIEKVRAPGDRIEPRRVDNEFFGEEQLQSRVGLLLGLGARKSLSDMGVPEIEAGETSFGADFPDSRGVTRKNRDLVGGQEREVSQPRGGGDLIGLAARWPESGDDVRTQIADRAPGRPVLIVSFESHHAKAWRGKDNRCSGILE